MFANIRMTCKTLVSSIGVGVRIEMWTRDPHRHPNYRRQYLMKVIRF
jgi:hypothetical protein